MAILSGLALAGCSREPAAAEPVDGTPLKSLAPFPVGVAVQAAQLGDPAWTALAATHFTQLTAEWEMKMEYVVQADGSFRFDRADAIAAFARERGMRLFGHTLVWYANEPEAFARLDESRQSFAGALANYVTAMVGRYRGLASGWDVVNEPIRDDGSGPRDSLWSRKLGQIGHFKVAFEAARAADPQAVLFTNDYHLESKPAKLASYMRLIEQLLDAGVPLGGIGCQTHLDADLPAGAITRTLKALALGKVAAEYVLRWVPAGTHDWSQFLKPEEIRRMLSEEPVAVSGPFGLAYDPFADRWSESDDTAINYLMIATRD
jgi:endo-1,4-beta-xylanase